jgi:hypothetical protein
VIGDEIIEFTDADNVMKLVNVGQCKSDLLFRADCEYFALRKSAHILKFPTSV